MSSLIEIHRDDHGRIAKVDVDLWEFAIIVLVLAIGLHWIFG